MIREAMTKKGKGERGFTLIELLIVVSVIAISTAIAVPTFSSWTPKFRLNSAADNLEKNLMLARVSAISQNKDVVVKFYESQRKYKITYKEDVAEFELPPGVHFSGITMDTLTFNPIGQADSNMEIKVYSDSEKLTDKKRKVTVRAVTGIARVSRGW